jgi:hypothetical protein
MKLYSPPNKGYPQELPDRWRFDNGTIRTDLKELSDSDLALLGWVGPIPTPIARQKDENGDDILESYDYDPATHKPVWYTAQRRFVFLGKNVDETPYTSGQLVTSIASSGIPDWNSFKLAAMVNQPLNQFIAQIVPHFPIPATALPTAILLLESGDSSYFISLWSGLKQLTQIPPQLTKDLISIARACNLPDDIIDVLD